MSKRITPKKPRAKRVQETKNETDQPTTSKIEVPLDIALSLLKPDELEKLRRYAVAYQEKYKVG